MIMMVNKSNACVGGEGFRGMYVESRVIDFATRAKSPAYFMREFSHADTAENFHQANDMMEGLHLFTKKK